MIMAPKYKKKALWLSVNKMNVIKTQYNEMVKQRNNAISKNVRKSSYFD